ncbi:MAG: glutamate synthase large subunit [Anaeromicrobium sp.]|jgi:glutamate synthase (NADPH/NADH) large chain|uniref:glutamate synthase large subunit n=1 Tax=Anaeromicrobium sp. TaxID=1929132 RepID=UPI0025F7304C|nr:glutamate synthase large subunit [Anaeromicrobium sp.]MCT4595481.1 glutamate synthase large subunit [Anaeromicrobium sp.]
MWKYGLPNKQGLYNPYMEKDSCGVGFIANLKGHKSYKILEDSLELLKNLKHRGAVGADEKTGDGSGIMIQIPHEFLIEETKKIGIELPEEGKYAVGMIFLPRQPNGKLFCEGVYERVIREEGQGFIGWREVPIDEGVCGELAVATRPCIRQIFIERKGIGQDEFNRKLLIIRKRVRKIILDSKKNYMENFYTCSLSTKTIIYKGQILGHKLDQFYLDLRNKKMATAMAIVHERYSTNTFPSWKLAQPFRYLAHNGEINTIRGNINHMNAREGVLKSKTFGDDIEKIFPIIEGGGSDSAALDNALEFFIANNHPIEDVMMMLIPEAWQNDKSMDFGKRGFYEYFARLMEGWDGPATISFTDGRKIGIILDKNGLRPARYIITKDNRIIMASEVGAIKVLDENVEKKGRIEPGKILLLDTIEGRVIPDEEIKYKAVRNWSYSKWVNDNRVNLHEIKKPYEIKRMRIETLLLKQNIFGYTKEEMDKVIKYMIENGKEPIGSMAIDIPLAVLSKKNQLLFDYFKQSFAQVTNPPIDPIREKNVMSLIQFIGSHGIYVDEIELDKNYKYIYLKEPLLDNKCMEDIRHLNDHNFRSITIPITFEIDKENGLKEALDHLRKRAEESVIEGYNIIILSDRSIGRFNGPIPSLLALGAVHHHLLKNKLRTSTDIIMEVGDARNVMDMALLIGYGAKAINPYMVYDTIRNLVENSSEIDNVDSLEEGFKNYSKAISKGLLKILSRVGISTLQSYNGAQIFQCVGINQEVVDEYFTNTPWVLSGIGLDKIREDVVKRHVRSYEKFGKDYEELEIGGELSYSPDGEHHMITPIMVKRLRRACIDNDYYTYKGYAKEVNEENEKIGAIRSLFKFKETNSISIDEVESVDDIVRRFTISGMSFGSLSKRAHETIGAAMNKIGGTSNCGEGGEESDRYYTDLRSAVKQVSTARFGVTANYLSNCEEIQIKMAQGAKPGEGGHLPGNKVTSQVAKVRNCISGIDLISPPPHHDIYSIEDLAQLIFDLKNVNTKARIGVKLVSQIGIGTVAAGVAKAFSDVIMISGGDGGTGASPISSMKYVGLPWELGLAEAQQTLLLNDLRSRVVLQVDGKIRTGRDIVIAALLGAEEYGFGTTALIAMGCVMCRQCHLNKCPMGIATQDEKLAHKFKGKEKHIINYLRFVAKEIREIMAQLGFKKLDHMIGRVDLLEIRNVSMDKIKDLDLTPILYKPELPSRIVGKNIMKQKHKINEVLDKRIIDLGKDAIGQGKKVEGEFNIKNTDRSVGAMLSGIIAKEYGDKGLKEDTINIRFKGSAGQSFGAFGMNGITFILEGDANDYVAKGLCGAKIIIKPPRKCTFIPEDNMIAGNTILYGATCGQVFINGIVGQRFAVRNSGATAVVEGVGNHACEYMTGGVVVILGPIGNNFGAGMSGGIAYVLDENNNVEDKYNDEMVEVKNLNDKDRDKLKDLIKFHHDYTKSPKAKSIMDNWEINVEKFKKIVCPVYEKLIEE